jgi:predicted DNA-binding protein
MSDSEAFEYYEDPAKREPQPGPPRRRPARPLTQHVPVRFPAETIEQVKRLADSDGMTVSAWIRRAVERAVHARGLSAEQIEGIDDPRGVMERLQRDVAELAAALTRSESRRARTTSD